MKNEIGRVYREIIEEVARLVEEDSASIGLSITQIHDLKVAWSRKLVEMTAVNQRSYDGYGQREGYGDLSRHPGSAYGHSGYNSSLSSMVFNRGGMNFNSSNIRNESYSGFSPKFSSLQNSTQSFSGSSIANNFSNDKNLDGSKPNPSMHSPILRSNHHSNFPQSESMTGIHHSIGSSSYGTSSQTSNSEGFRNSSHVSSVCASGFENTSQSTLPKNSQNNSHISSVLNNNTADSNLFNTSHVKANQNSQSPPYSPVNSQIYHARAFEMATSSGQLALESMRRDSFGQIKGPDGRNVSKSEYLEMLHANIPETHNSNPSFYHNGHFRTQNDRSGVNSGSNSSSDSVGSQRSNRSSLNMFRNNTNGTSSQEYSVEKSTASNSSSMTNRQFSHQILRNRIHDDFGDTKNSQPTHIQSQQSQKSTPGNHQLQRYIQSSQQSLKTRAEAADSSSDDFEVARTEDISSDSIDNSESDHDVDKMLEAANPNYMMCLYVKVDKNKFKWRVKLKQGFLNIGKTEYAFDNAHGDLTWC